jgi:hypothetical protein|tara:strand:+ start:25417 stop:26577 length:1161 start_codon:yes stop_codon:yes gene_type:complete
MANKLNGFLDNFFGGALNPKGNLGDFAHASRLYVDDAFRLAPKTKFLYFVNFNFYKDDKHDVLAGFPKMQNRHRAELNMLVKSVDLPQYRSSVDVKNAYNRKKNVQTRIDYTPVSMTMHDDNNGLTTMLMEAYYRYYYRDSNISDITASYDPRSTYKEANGRTYRFGLDNDKMVPFFKNIKLYQFSRHEYTEYTLVNPLIESWGHDTMDQTDGSGIAENKMTINYESVLYSRGRVGEDSPATFATDHYDTSPSPLSVAGGGVGNLFGAGGVLDGASSVLGDITSGNFGLGSVLTLANTVKNAKSLSSDSLKAEGLSILTGAITNAGKKGPGGLPGILVPKSNGNGGSANTTSATSNSATNNPALSAAKVGAAQAANNLPVTTGGDG